MSYNKKEVSYCDISVLIKKTTEKAVLVSVQLGESEVSDVWIPKSCLINVNYNSESVQTVGIKEFLLRQKGYALKGFNQIAKSTVETERTGQWTCVNCGASTKKGFKYCLDCYKKVKDYVETNTKIVSIFGFCKNCGHQSGIEFAEGKVFCERCGIKLADGKNDWINVIRTCEKCNEGRYEPYGYFVLKCNRCNYMVGINPIRQQTGGRSI